MTKFTRGPVKVEFSYWPGNKELQGIPSVYSSGAGLHVCELTQCDGAMEANGELIAAAFNAATEVEALGVDGIAAIKALPELLKALQSLADKSESMNLLQHSGCENTPGDWAALYDMTNDARTAIATARGKEELK